MAAISSSSNLRQIHFTCYRSGICHKEHSGENQILKSLFVNEIYPIFENFKLLPGGHIEFMIDMNFS